MPYDYNKRLTGNAQSLRKGMTPEEKHLWYDFLSLLPVTVNRQKVIGEYITDFYIHSANIVIEIDGIQHEEREHKKADTERDAYFAELGMRVLRYPNRAIRDEFNCVCRDILDALGLSFSDVRKK